MKLMRYNRMKKILATIPRTERRAKSSANSETRGGMFSSLGLRSRGQIIQLHNEISCCVSVCVLSKCLSDKDEAWDEKETGQTPESSVWECTARVGGALEAWCWNAVSHETEGDTTAPAEVVVWLKGNLNQRPLGPDLGAEAWGRADRRVEG